MRLSRLEMCLEMCSIASKRGTCPRARVGCVIERDGRILTTGYNGSLPGEAHCDEVGCLMEAEHCVRTNHAEANAICWAARQGIATEGATLYVTGWAKGICPTCKKLATMAGITKIVTYIDGELHVEEIHRRTMGAVQERDQTGNAGRRGG